MGTDGFEVFTFGNIQDVGLACQASVGIAGHAVSKATAPHINAVVFDGWARCVPLVVSNASRNERPHVDRHVPCREALQLDALQVRGADRVEAVLLPIMEPFPYVQVPRDMVHHGLPPLLGLGATANALEQALGAHRVALFDLAVTALIPTAIAMQS